MLEEKFFWLSALNLEDIPYNGDSRETLDRVHVKFVLPKGALMSKTVATFVQKVSFTWLKGGIYFSYSGHKCNCWLKIVNHWDKRYNGVMCTGKEIWFKSGLILVRRGTYIVTRTCKLLSRKKPEHWDISIVLL